MLEGHFGGWAAVRQDCYVVEAVELILDSLGKHLFVVNCCMQWKLASDVNYPCQSHLSQKVTMEDRTGTT